MLAMLPPDPRRAAVEWLVLLGLVALPVFWRRSRRWSRVARCGFRASAIPLGALGLYLILNPNVARVTRIYYQGRDQFQWARQFRSGDAAARQKAAAALTHMLWESRSIARHWVVQELGDGGREAEVAVPVLTELASNPAEDEWLREQAQRAVARITGGGDVDAGAEDVAPNKTLHLTAAAIAGSWVNAHWSRGGR